MRQYFRDYGCFDATLVGLSNLILLSEETEETDRQSFRKRT